MPEIIIGGLGPAGDMIAEGLGGSTITPSPVLSLVNAIPQTNGELRAIFTNPPLASSSIGVHDALNVANYVLTGPSAAPQILAATIVDFDLKSIDLALAAPLSLGTWTLTASTNITSPSGNPITAPFSASFVISTIGPTATVNLGSVSDEPEDIIRKHLNPAIKGLATDSLIAALATGDRTNFTNAASIFDQLFISSASGIYLDRKTADFRIQKPVNVGITDDLYRRFAIKTKNKKVVLESLLEILEVFYGPDALRAHVSTEATETFPLSDGDDLQILVDERVPVQVIFRDSDFSQIPFAKANEVAAAITRALRSQGTRAYAISFVDPLLGGGARVKMYSGTLGLGSFLRVTGGRAQDFLLFPTQLISVYTTSF